MAGQLVTVGAQLVMVTSVVAYTVEVLQLEMEPVDTAAVEIAGED